MRWVNSFLDWRRERTRRRRCGEWEARWSKPMYAPKWGKRDAPPEVVEAVANGWLPPTGRVLDIGCGLGEIAAWFAVRGYAALGVDIAPAAIRKAQKLYEQLPSPPQLVARDLCAVPPPGGPFDILIDRGCLHTIEKSLVPDFMRNISIAAAPHARMMLFKRAFRDGQPFGDEAETRMHVEWVERVMAGHFAIEKYKATYLSSDGKLDPSNPLPGLAFWLTRTPSGNG